MKHRYTTPLVVMILLSCTGFAQQAATSAMGVQSNPAVADRQEETPAQQNIAAARLQLKADSKKVQAWNELALAYLRRVRETDDRSYLKQADDALAEGLKIDSTDFQLLRTQVAVLLGRRDWVQARDRATLLHRRTPDDVMTYGYIAEADIALGDYEDALTNAQWMLNLRPHNIPGLLMGARLRAIYGNPHGAIEFLDLAYAETSPAEVEELAWIANQIASIQLDLGLTMDAEKTLEGAAQLFANYPYTMRNTARLKRAQNRAGDAAQLLKQLALIDSDPAILYELAKAQQAAGQEKEAHATEAKFERLANDPANATDESKVDLILLYSENPATAANALKLAQQEVVARHDVWTLDAEAWALFENRRYQDADAAVQKAMTTGTQSDRIFDHAGHIAEKLNHSADATKYFLLAAQTNATSDYATDARKSMGVPETVEADARKPKQSESLTAAVPPEGTHPSGGATNLAKEIAGSGDPPFVARVPAFAPVPEAVMTPRPTSTDHLVHTAQAAVSRNSRDSSGYAELGVAYFQRARETGDISDYQMAEEALRKSLDLVSADFSADSALETMAEVCMGEHRFADALGYAQKALSLGTGDVSPFAIVGDAYADMGEYEKGSAAYARLTPRDMTLAPRAAYARDSRLSYLKFVTGDTAGAITLMKTAVTEGLEAQLPSENLSWLYYELGEFETLAGDAAAADAAYLAALYTHPGDYRALAALGKLRANHGRYAEAIELYQKAITVVPMPTFIAELGDLYAKSGNQAEAQKQYALVEYIGLLGHINQVLHNRDLALFYADHDMKLAESLDLARKELEVRHDIYTWDALSWALYKNGKLQEAAQASDKAAQFGTRDALILFHSGMIAEAMGRSEQARSELKAALQINPHFHLVYADKAQEKLTALEARSEAKGGSNSHAR
jgi:tetratricopeptide (TPR) repeat protein